MKYCYLDKNIKAQNMMQLVQGQGYIPIHLQDDLVIPNDATQIAVHGVLRGNGNLIRQARERGIDWLYMDNGYLETYKRICLNSTAPTTMTKGRRFEHNTKFEKWRGGSGEYILVLPPSPPYMETFEGDCRNFLNICAHTINIYTDRDIIIRAKPAKGRLAKPWDEQLKKAYCVVTWGSALALDAMIKGVPTISLGWCPASFASKRFEDIETSNMLEEPDREAIVDNLTHTSFEKNELSFCYNKVKDILRL